MSDKCKWNRYDGEDFITDCKHIYCPPNEGMDYNFFKYCPFCAKQIQEVSHER